MLFCVLVERFGEEMLCYLEFSLIFTGNLSLPESKTETGKKLDILKESTFVGNKGTLYSFLLVFATGGVTVLCP